MAFGRPVAPVWTAGPFEMPFSPNLVPHTAQGRPSIRSRPNLVNTDRNRTLANAGTRHLQTIVFACFAQMDLDAVVYPTGNIPPAIMTAPEEPNVNDRSPGLWTYVNSRASRR